MPKKPSSTFCVVPWIHHYTEVEGNFYPCTMAHDQRHQHLDENGGRIDSQTPGGIAKAWNSETMRAMRRQMLNGERPEVCTRCFTLEDLAMKSFRQHVNEARKDMIPSLMKSAAPDGSAPLKLRHVDIRMGNLCNLRCRMCSPEASRQLVDEFVQIHPEGSKAHWESYRKLDWFERKEYWEELLSNFGDVDRLHLAGGEPFINLRGWALLEKLVESGQSSKISLSYNTNMTTLPRQARELWPHFKSVDLMASVDAFGALNTYIRYPSEWTTISENLRAVDRDRRALNVVNFRIHTVAQAYNIFSLAALFDFMATFEFLSPFPDIDFVSNPECFEIQILPDHLKELARKRLENHVLKLSPNLRTHPRCAEFVTSLKGVGEHMFAESKTHLIPEFKRYTEVLDQNRGQRLAEFVPELANL